jgi:hypothetical protein
MLKVFFGMQKILCWFVYNQEERLELIFQRVIQGTIRGRAGENKTAGGLSPDQPPNYFG